MQIAVDSELNLIAVVLVKDARNRAREGFKAPSAGSCARFEIRRRVVEAGSQRGGDDAVALVEDSDKDVDYTLDNYATAFISGRLYVFYEGVTSFDARSGKERLREKYRVNEEGLALTEADPIFADAFIYVSGRGRVRAISRKRRHWWEAKDLGLTPEMLLVGDVLYVRTGGQFTRLKTATRSSVVHMA